jgi:hypothetical protein
LKSTRVEIKEDPIELKPGEYGKWNGHWWVYPPKEDAGPIPITGYKPEWEVVENADGTITVSPSINVVGRLAWIYHLQSNDGGLEWKYGLSKEISATELNSASLSTGKINT